MTTLAVTAARPYDVVVAAGARHRLPDLIADDVRRVGIVVNQALRAVGEELAEGLRPKHAATVIVVPEGEAAKDVAVLSSCWTRLAEAGFTRSDLLVGVGGGATTDLAGFVAATWLRGVDFVTVPTTVLGMVDAAVGGKTGIDLPAGKNLVGAFHEPLGVLCDVDLLSTLPVAELRSGLAEVAKCGFISDSTILDDLAQHPQLADDPGHPVLPSVIVKGIRVKIDRIADDLTERTTAEGQRLGREAVNYGHTLGHAIERHRAYGIRHGEAISVGMVFAAELAHAAGLIDRDLVERHRHVLTRLGLPISYEGGVWDELLAGMRLDKKTRGDQLRFVVLDGLGSVRILAGPQPAWLTASYERVTG